MVPLRKARAGGTSLGFDWPTDGSVVEVPDDVAVELLAIKDGTFTVAEVQPVTDPTPEPDPAPAPAIEPAPGPSEITEPEPDPDESVAEVKAPAKKAAVRRTTPKS